MEKHILQWSYWLGLICFAIAFGWRGLATFGWVGGMFKTVAYTTLYKAGFLFMLTAVATANAAWFKSQKP